MSSPIVIGKPLSRKIASLGFLLMLGVVSLHVQFECRVHTFGWWTVFLWKKFSCVAVPFFFVVSGFLLAGRMCESKWWWNSCCKRARTLLVPYIIWNVIGWLFLILITITANLLGSQYGGGDLHNYGAMKWLAVFGLLNEPPQVVHLWYVRMLLIFVLIAPLFLICRHRLVGMFIVAVLFLCYAFFLSIGGERISYFWEWFLSLRGLAYLSLGAYLRFHPIRVKYQKSLGVFILIIGLALLFAIGCGYASWGGLISFMLLLAGVWLVLPDLDLPEYLTEATFPIYVLHWFIPILMIGIVERTALKTMCCENLWLYFIQVFVIFIFSWAVARVFKRIFPGFYRVAFGGR